MPDKPDTRQARKHVLREKGARYAVSAVGGVSFALFAKALAGGSLKRQYAALWSADPASRSGWIKQGLPGSMLDCLVKDMRISWETLAEWTGISRSIAARKRAVPVLLNAAAGERALGLARLIGQVQTIVEQSGDSEGFEASTWLTDWLTVPNPALEGAAPGAHVHNADGRALLSSLIARMQSGAYA